MVVPELEQQLLQLSPDDKLYIIQLLAQSLTTDNNNTQPVQTSKISEFFRQSPVTELPEEKKYITITDPKQVILSDLPFQAGQRVEIIILAEENPRASISKKLRDLFDQTQSLPGIQDITEAEIAAEIEAYRRGE